MTNFSLYKRLTEMGTLSEPNGNPDPQFALPSTINWMRALSIVINNENICYKKCRTFYLKEKHKPFKDQVANSAMEHILFAVHQLSALEATKNVLPKSDVARVSVVTWYYAIYWAAKAMMVLSDGSIQDNHTATANNWLAHFAKRNRALHPFGLFVDTIASREMISEIENQYGSSGLVNSPTNEDEAEACLVGYLKGTINWTKWKKSEEIKKTPEFKSIKINGNSVSNFRGKEAQTLRNQRFSKQGVCFLHQAFRYRGKANYREGLFLAHGTGVESSIDGFIEDMIIVSKAFIVMAAAYCSMRLGDKLWSDFINDIEKYKSFSLSPKTLFQ